MISAIKGSLATADFEVRDAPIFPSRLLHGSLSNQTDWFRISIDNYYYSIEESVDGRWVGEDSGDYYNFGYWDESKPMDELCEE